MINGVKHFISFVEVVNADSPILLGTNQKLAHRRIHHFWREEIGSMRGSVDAYSLEPLLEKAK